MGHLPLGAITVDHGFEILRKIPAERSSSTRRNVTIVLMRPMRYAVFPCKLIDKYPFPEGFLPRRQKPRAKAFLYPEEEAQYLACVEIPLPERLLVGVLTREGLRVEELTGAQVKDFDPKTRWFHLDENKTDDPRTRVMREDTARRSACTSSTSIRTRAPTRRCWFRGITSARRASASTHAPEPPRFGRTPSLRG